MTPNLLLQKCYAFVTLLQNVTQCHLSKTSSLILWQRASTAPIRFVTVGEGAVVGARAAVFKDVEPWTVVGGNPAKIIKERIINNNRNMIKPELGGAICLPIDIVFAATLRYRRAVA